MKRLGLLLSPILLAGTLGAATLNQKAPAFSLVDSQHKKHSLADYKGKVVLINFWASWCAPCQAELPELNRLAAKYPRNRFRVLAINVDTQSAPAKKLLASLGRDVSTLDILWDPQSKVVSAYSIDAMPSSFVIDANGVLRFSHTGFHPNDPAAWRAEVGKLLGS